MENEREGKGKAVGGRGRKVREAGRVGVGYLGQPAAVTQPARLLITGSVDQDTAEEGRSRDSTIHISTHTHRALLGCEIPGVAGAAVNSVRYDFARLPIVWCRPARHELSS